MTVCSQCGFEAHEAFRFCPECGLRSAGAADGDPLVGRTLAGKYRVRSVVGAGSMGTVYRAEHTALQKPTAIKVLHRELQVSDDAIRRFQREGIAAGRFTHANAIQVFDFDRTDDGRFFLAMEFVSGDDLKAFLENSGPLSAEDAVDLTCQLLDTLTEAHGHGIVHRDLKPENLMVIESSTGVRNLKVLDFGLSKLVDREVAQSMQTVAGRVLGTPLYMAPEQWRGGDVDHRADLYAVGLILFEMLAGRSPLAGRDVTELALQATSDPPPEIADFSPGKTVPDDLNEVLHLALAKDPDARFQSAREMLAAVEGVRFDVVSTRRSTRRSAGRSGSRIGRRGVRSSSSSSVLDGRRPRWLPIAVAGAVVAVVVVVLSVTLGGSDSQATVRLLSAKPVAARTAAEQAYVDLVAEARDRLVAGDTATARTLVEKALRSESADAEGLLVRALVARRRGDTDTAFADLNEALQGYPEYGAAMAWIGWIHFEREEFDQARAKFEAAAELADGAAEGLAGSGAVLVRAGDHDAAKEMLDRAIVAQPGLGRAHLWRGRACFALDDLEGAVESFVQAKRRDPSLWEAFEGAGDAYAAKGNAEAAIQSYRDALGVDDAAHSARWKLIKLLIAASRWDDAATLIEPALVRVQGANGVGDTAAAVELRIAQSLIALGQDRSPDAITGLETALEEGGQTALAARARLLLANLHLQRGAYAHAARLCETASIALKERADLFTTWGLALFRDGQHRQAAERLARAAELTPNDTFVRYTLGVIHMDYLADPEGALVHLRAYRDQGGIEPRVEGWIRELER